MHPVTYPGMLFFLSTTALAAPSHHHNHLGRHRDRAATHAHIKHDHEVLARRAEQVRLDSLKAAQAEIQDSPAGIPPRQSPSEEGPIVTLWGRNTGPKTVVTSPGEVGQRCPQPMVDRGDLGYRRSKVAAHGEVELEHAVEGLESRQLHAATRLLLAHTARKNH